MWYLCKEPNSKLMEIGKGELIIIRNITYWIIGYQ